MPMHESKRRSLARSPGLVDQERQLAKLDEHLIHGKPVRPGRQDGRLDHCVLGAIKSQKVPLSALGHCLDDNSGPLFPVVELDNPELVITTGVGQDLARDHVGRARAGAGIGAAPIAV